MRCTQMTDENTRCEKICKVGTDYCSTHFPEITDVCAICLDDPSECPKKLIACNHVFCKKVYMLQKFKIIYNF